LTPFWVATHSLRSPDIDQLILVMTSSRLGETFFVPPHDCPPHPTGLDPPLMVWCPFQNIRPLDAHESAKELLYLRLLIPPVVL